MNGQAVEGEAEAKAAMVITVNENSSYCANLVVKFKVIQSSYIIIFNI